MALTKKQLKRVTEISVEIRKNHKAAIDFHDEIWKKINKLQEEYNKLIYPHLYK